MRPSANNTTSLPPLSTLFSHSWVLYFTSMYLHSGPAKDAPAAAAEAQGGPAALELVRVSGASVPAWGERPAK